MYVPTYQMFLQSFTIWHVLKKQTICYLFIYSKTTFIYVHFFMRFICVHLALEFIHLIYMLKAWWYHITEMIFVHLLRENIIIFLLLINYRYGSGVVTGKCRNWGEFNCISYKRIQYKEHQCCSDCKRCCWKLQSITNHCCNPCWFFLWLILCCLYIFLCCFAGKLHQTISVYPYICMHFFFTKKKCKYH